MSTDIKPGQVWAWKHDGHQGDRFTITALNGDMAQYKYGEGVANVHYSTPIALLQADATLYGWDVAPAPLDPSKGGPFGGGDSVRYVGPPHRSYTAVGIIPGRVFTVRDGTNVENGVISLYGSSGMFSAIKFELVSRADHQPAPEPEAAASEIGDAIRELKHVVRTEDEIEGIALQVDDLWNRVQAHRVGVVIDPADVDVDALTTTLYEARHYGANLSVEAASYLARVARKFFLGEEATR